MIKRIVIDVTPLLYSLNQGISLTTHMLIQGILSLESNFEVVLFGRRMQGTRLNSLGLGVRNVHLRLPRSLEHLIQKTKLVERLCRGDLYHATDFYLPLANPEKAVATIHDLIFLIQPEAMVDHVRLAKWVPDFARRCCRIIAVSEFSKHDIVERLGIDAERISVVYNGIDRKMFHPVEDKPELDKRLYSMLGFKRPYFLAVSCSTGRKNTPALLTAYSRLLQNNPRNDLVLVWDPPEEIKRRYDSPKGADRIHFVGKQSAKNLADLYRGATALIFPSLYEGFGLPILEAMSCGTPVVTSNITSMPEIGGDAAVYVDPRNLDSIISSLERFEDEESLALELREKCITQAAKFSWIRCVKETMEVYRHCLEDLS